jgi:uncharacterized protein
MAATAAANAQSFDCRHAHFADEQVICQEPDLGRLDNRLDSVFRHRMARLPRRERDALERKETDWVVSRRQCGHNYECIEHSYRERMADLSAALPDDGRARSSAEAAGEELSVRASAAKTRTVKRTAEHQASTVRSGTAAVPPGQPEPNTQATSKDAAEAQNSASGTTTKPAIQWIDPAPARAHKP